MEPLISEREATSDTAETETSVPSQEARAKAEAPRPEASAASGEALAAPEPAPQAPPSPEERLLGELAGLRSRVEERFANDRLKEQQIERLHRELQSYKQDFLARLQHPLLLGLIRLYNDLGRTVAALRDRPPAEQTPQRFLDALDGLEDDLVLLLEQHGVERFESPGPAFDPARQTALRIVETAEAELVGRIVERLRPGFTHGKTQLQREGVAVYAAGAANDRAAPPADPAVENVPGGDLE